MELKISTLKNKILLQIIKNNTISSEIIISPNEISIMINDQTFYKQNINKIEFKSDLIEVFADIINIKANDSIKFNSNTSKFNLNQNSATFSSPMYESYSNKSFEIISDFIYLNNS